MAKKIAPFYNIEQTVGRDCTNTYDDVLLVQFFLSEIAKGSSLPLKPPTVKLEMTGLYSDVLDLYIIWFQGCLKKAGKLSSIDGKMSPADNKNPYGNPTTIAHMNVAYRNRYKTSHDVLENVTGLPFVLSTKFKNPKLVQQ